MGVKRGVIPGRYQPFHKGHLHLIKWALERLDEVIIVIGSAQESHTLQNPLTAGERVLSIKRALECEGIDLSKVYLIPVPDILMNRAWVSHVETYVPKFHVAISRNPLVKVLFREAGYEVLEPPAFERNSYVATNIRALIAKGDKRWKELVPKCVAEVLEEINLEERMRELLRRD
ncbi:nicotinamide-nucleotide adenylyltransferase [Ignicoccus islandicus DSM 13165]|uniref:Nicotinamide-nucleotide adenylyltransferase n=1 Tax=Ignicoccus islandicus DSM 13165 TaxID=940295 RepID=A0A0U2WL04_9CREN|nr:nicotinamide-nucleotide adenylyltransferase [Ignicoccus islandicus]ALU11617.1 nicotinamide-nucleotide adenylyltransferase [Ignicoccus islandicus DSM 13165]